MIKKENLVSEGFQTVLAIFQTYLWCNRPLVLSTTEDRFKMFAGSLSPSQYNHIE